MAPTRPVGVVSLTRRHTKDSRTRTCPQWVSPSQRRRLGTFFLKEQNYFKLPDLRVVDAQLRLRVQFLGRDATMMLPVLWRVAGQSCTCH
jgi:hypothetical protein